MWTPAYVDWAQFESTCAELAKAVNERDALRAENERLREAADDVVSSGCAAKDLPEGWSMVKTSYLKVLADVAGLSEGDETEKWSIDGAGG
jgi:hypothetical protein